jgi:O-antigen ligase
MPRRFALALVIVVVLANGAATVLYSGVGPTDPVTNGAAASWNPVLELFADLLTLPIATPGITDIRDITLLACLGLALLVAAAASLWGARPSSDPGAAGAVAHRQAMGSGNSAVAGLGLAAGAVILLALLSAAANGTFDLSWGWIVRFVAGTGWAILIARTFSARMTRQALRALLVVALVCLAATILDRADRDLAHFRWPIGPITTTAAIAAVWASMSGAWAVGLASHKRFGAGLLLAGVVCVVAVYVMQQTGRRAPVLGLVAATVVTAAVLLGRRYRRRVVRVGIVGVIGLLTVGAGAYVIGQLRSPTREVSGPLKLRLAYWEQGGDLIAAHPLLGWGPDTFVVRMTNAIAPLRAESPHFYHGNITLYAHCEWMQAAVELGIPAALAYIGLPIGMIAWAARSLRQTRGGPQKRKPGQTDAGSGDASNRVLMVTLIAGLTAILVTEMASITLRTPVMPVWFWTMLGLLGSLCPARVGVRGEAHRRHLPRRGSVAALAVMGLGCFAVCTVETRRASAEAREERGPDGRFGSRLYAEKTISAHHKAAVRASHRAQARREPRHIELARSLWGDLYHLMPALHDVPARYAEVLKMAGQPDAARAVLEDALSDGLNPYNVEANVGYAGLLAEDPVERFRCVQRALRSGALNAALRTIMSGALEHAAVVELLEAELPGARTVATGQKGGSVSEPIVELLRIKAFGQRRRGLLNEAITDQRLAAHFYRRLEREHDPYRRAAEAETDAFLVLAEVLYEANPGNYEQAYDAICEAERYAVLGINHQRVGKPEPEKGFVGGEILPTEFPRRLRGLWRLSALLHVVGGNEHFLIGRVKAGLPPEAWNDDEAVRQELGRIYRRAYDDMISLPSAKRPEHLAHLREMARAFAGDGVQPTDTPVPQVQTPD